MYGELQAVAEWLALHVIRSKPKKKRKLPFTNRYRSMQTGSIHYAFVG